MAWSLVYGPTQGSQDISKETWHCTFEAVQTEALPALGVLLTTIVSGKTLPSTDLVQEPELVHIGVVTKKTKLMKRFVGTFAASRVDTAAGNA